MTDVADIARELHEAGFVVTLDLRVEAAGAAALLGVTPKTLRNQRCELRGPRWELRHGHVLYAISDLLEVERDEVERDVDVLGSRRGASA